VSPLTSLINTIHHGQLSPQQREALIGLLLRLSACHGMTSPEISHVQTAYTELLAASQAEQPTPAKGAAPWVDAPRAGAWGTSSVRLVFAERRVVGDHVERRL
jgi:hypothetical protein